MTFLIPIAGGGPLTRTYTGIGGTAASSTQDRHVFACLVWTSGFSGALLTSCTIAGVSVSILVQSATLVSGLVVSTAIVAAQIPAGVSGSVTPVFGGATTGVNYALYDVENWSGSVANSAVSAAKPSSMPLSTSAGTIAIAVVAATDSNASDPTASASWVNLIEDGDTAFDASNIRYITVASAAFPAAASITVTCTHTHTGNLQNACAVVLA